MLDGVLIDCGACTMQDSPTCEDCVVTYVLDRPAGAVVFDAEEERAIRSLQKAGLAPETLFEPRAAG